MASSVPVEHMEDKGTEPWAIQKAPQLPNNKDIQSSRVSTIPNHPPPLHPMNPFGSLFDLTSDPIFSTCSLNEASTRESNVEADRHRAQVDKLMNEMNNLKTQLGDNTVIIKKLFKKLNKAKEDLNQTMTGSSLRLKRVQHLEKQRDALFAYYTGMLRAPTNDMSQGEQGLPDSLPNMRHLNHLCDFLVEKYRAMIRGLEQEEEEGTEQSVGDKSSSTNALREAERELEPLKAMFKFLRERLQTEEVYNVFPDVDSTDNESAQMVTNVDGTKEEQGQEKEKEEQEIIREDRELDLENGEESETNEINRLEDDFEEWKDQLKSPSSDTDNMKKYHLVTNEVLQHVFPNNTEGEASSNEQVQNRELGSKNGDESQYIEMNREGDEPKDQPKSLSSNTSLDEMGAFNVFNPESLDTDFILTHVLLDDQKDSQYAKMPHVGNVGLGFFPGNPELNRIWGFTEPEDIPSSLEQPPTSSVMATSEKGVSLDNIKCEMSSQVISDEQVQSTTGMSSDDDASPSTGKCSHRNCCRSS